MSSCCSTILSPDPPGKVAALHPAGRGHPELEAGAPVVRGSPRPAGGPRWAVPVVLRPRPHRGQRPAVVPHHEAGLRRPVAGPGVPGAGGGVAGHVCAGVR